MGWLERLFNFTALFSIRNIWRFIYVAMLPYFLATPNINMDRSHELDDGESSTNENQPNDWAMLSDEERDEFLTETFDKEVPLEQIGRPDLCRLHSQFEDEIADAYLKHTTFVVKVWANYDGAAKEFFYDQRVEDCGKLILTSKQREDVDRIVRDITVSKIRFDIGTAFRTLARLTVEVRGTVDGRQQVDVFKDVSACQDHSKLAEEVRDLQGDMKNVDITPGKDGFSLADIDELAMWFVKPSGPAEVPRQNRWRRSIEIDDRENHGYLKYLSEE